MSNKHQHYTELMTETDRNPTNLQVVEASIKDFKMRQYEAYIKGGSSEDEASRLSGFTPKTT